MKFIQSAALALLAITSASQAQAPIRVLFWGGTATGTHNSRALRDTLTPVFAANNMTLNYREAASHSWLNPDSLAQYDVAFLYTTDQVGTDMSAAQLTHFTNWINAGHVAVAFHGSTNTYLSNGTLSANWVTLLGGLFLDHGNGTDNGGTITFQASLHPTLVGLTPLPTSALNSGGTPYWDEGRRHKNYASDTVVLARSRLNSSDTAVPWIWVRAQGQGWVYYNASGHNGEVWKRPEFKAQVVQAIKWGNQVKVTGLRGKAALNALIRTRNNELLVPIADAHSVRIHDMSGKKVYSSGRSQQGRYDLGGLPLGVYSIEVLTRKDVFHSVYVKKP